MYMCLVKGYCPICDKIVIDYVKEKEGYFYCPYCHHRISEQ